MQRQRLLHLLASDDDRLGAPDRSDVGDAVSSLHVELAKLIDGRREHGVVGLPIATEGPIGSCVARTKGKAETPRPSPHNFRNSLVLTAVTEPEGIQHASNPSG